MPAEPVPWSVVEAAAPELAARVRERFAPGRSHVLATLRADGSPRVWGSEVEFIGADLLIGSMPNARKVDDLRRDGRLALHAEPGELVGEGPASAFRGDAKIYGVAEVTARPADPAPANTASTADDGPDGGPTGEAAGTDPPKPPDVTFRVRITEVVTVQVNQPAEELIIDSFHAGEAAARHYRRNNYDPARRLE